MKKSDLITRRNAIVTGLAAAGGFLVTRLPDDLPPTYGNLLRMGDSFTYAAQRVLLPTGSLVREYSHGDITSFPATGTVDPGSLDLPGLSDAYRELQHGAFATWRLPVATSNWRRLNVTGRRGPAFSATTARFLRLEAATCAP